MPKPGDGQSGIDASCGSALKDILVRVYRSNSEPTKPWQQRLRQALETMGAEAAAASAQRHLDRAAARCDHTLGHTFDVTGMAAWQGATCIQSRIPTTCHSSCCHSSCCHSSSAVLCGFGRCKAGLPAGRRELRTELRRGLEEVQAKAEPWVVASKTHRDCVTNQAAPFKFDCRHIPMGLGAGCTLDCIPGCCADIARPEWP